MNISDELERILKEMDSDEQRKAQESNVAKQMALLADGGTPTGVTKKTPTGANDLIKELKEQMYGADPVNTYMPTQQDFSTQLMQYLAQMFMPGLVQQGQYNVPTAAHGNYADVPSHASGGSIGYHQPGSLEQNMMALGGHRALPIIMALHKANGGRIDLPKFAGGGDLSVSEQLAQDVGTYPSQLMPGVPQDTSDKEPSPYPFVAYHKSTLSNDPYNPDPPYFPGPDKPGVQSLDPISVHMQTPSFLQNLGENILGAADLGKTLVGGTLGMVPATLETVGRMFSGPHIADIYEQALNHWTPDLMTQRGKEMGEDLAEFMRDYKIPLALPELMAFEGALGPGAGAALRKSNQALKALEPEAGTLGSNLGNVFYSALDNAAQGIKRKVGTGAEFMQELMGKGGIKQSEITERGLGDLMEAPKMTHEQFMKALEDKPLPATEVKIKDGNGDNSNLPTHERWTLPGGDNYREMLIKAPKKIEKGYKSPNGAFFTEEELADPVTRKTVEKIGLSPAERDVSDHFGGVSSHFGGEPNILASMRLKDRTGPNGEKLLHLEELQSDWHQQGREKGYIPSDMQKAKDNIQKRLNEIDAERTPLYERQTLLENAYNKKSYTDELSAIQTQLNNLQREYAPLANQLSTGLAGVPDAPFKKNWEEMALKRLIHHAAENNYDGIVVTPGAEQADRYSLAKHISNLHYSGSSLFAFDPEGNEVIYRTGVRPQDLPELVGKELADKLMSQEPIDNHRSLHGVDLQVGGEGMKGFYDKKVPNILNGIGKKYGVKTELNAYPIETEPANRLQVGEMTYVDPAKFAQVHHFPITEDMKKDVLSNGLPMYRNGGLVQI